jgi:Transposase DDE domain
MPCKVNQERRHRIPKVRYRVKNWRDYDAALHRRGDLTVWVTAEAIEAWTPASTGRRGRPQRYSAIAVETGLLLRLAFGRPWR